METKHIEVTGGIAEGMPVFTPDGKVPTDGSYEGQIVWQFDHWGKSDFTESWTNCANNDPTIYTGCKQRQIWVVKLQVEQPEPEEEWTHPDEYAIGSLNEDLKAMTAQRDELIKALELSRDCLDEIRHDLTENSLDYVIETTKSINEILKNINQ